VEEQASQTNRELGGKSGTSLKSKEILKKEAALNWEFKVQE